MSPIIGIINAKGGVGKTVSTIYLAHALTNAGYSVEVWDADPQGSATDWAFTAEENGGEFPFEVSPVNVPQLKKRRTTAEVTLIDSPPLNESILNAIAQRSDALIIPAAPAGLDITRVFSTLASIPEGKPAAVLLTSADPRTVLFRETKELLEESGITIFGTSIRPKQSVRASYGLTPDDLVGYDDVAAQLITLIGLEKES